MIFGQNNRFGGGKKREKHAEINVPPPIRVINIRKEPRMCISMPIDVLNVFGFCYVYILAIVFEEIMFQNRRNLDQQRCVNAFALENTIYVCSVAA